MKPLKIGILSRMTRCYSTQRLKEAATARGHHARVYDTLKFAMTLEHANPGIHYKTKPMSEVDAVIPRIGASITFFGLAVVRQFEQMGVYCANDSTAIARSRDKLRAMQTLSRHDIGIPPTVFARDGSDILPAIRRVGGTPVIIKLLEGTQGVGVILADTEKAAEAIIQTLQSARQNVLIQKFVKESKGTDVRAFVVGDRVVAAMRRRAREGEFRSNVHRGGKAERIDLDDVYSQTAVRAAQIMGLRVAGVDMLESSDGPQIMEVNSSPGLEGIERASGLDVAGAIIADIEQHVNIREVDLKQRLRLAGGFGIVEFGLHGIPQLEGHKLRETDLSRRNIHVISVTRQSHVVPNPTGDFTLLAGDELLCYGDLRELRKLMPLAEPKRRRKAK